MMSLIADYGSSKTIPGFSVCQNYSMEGVNDSPRRFLSGLTNAMSTDRRMIISSSEGLIERLINYFNVAREG